jgi:hypothetical protein
MKSNRTEVKEPFSGIGSSEAMLGFESCDKFDFVGLVLIQGSSVFLINVNESYSSKQLKLMADELTSHNDS